jgi:hypothetical protein
MEGKGIRASQNMFAPGLLERNGKYLQKCVIPVQTRRTFLSIPVFTTPDCW